MRIATWNVNSLPARLERVGLWLERAAPDVLLLQETKLTDEKAPRDWFADRGYALAHHGEGAWNGVAIASRVGLDDVEVHFGDPGPGEARMIAATVSGVRVVSVYVPNGRTLGSPTYAQKLAWFARLQAWVGARSPADPLVIGGDYNVAPADIDVWEPAAAHGGTHVSAPERDAVAALRAWGLADVYRDHHAEGDRFSWWDYRAGMFHKNYGMRIDLLLATAPVAARVVWVDIDREARKGKPTPSDHAPVLMDLDAPGRPIDPGWASADERIAQRRKK